MQHFVLFFRVLLIIAASFRLCYRKSSSSRAQLEMGEEEEGEERRVFINYRQRRGARESQRRHIFYVQE